MFQAPIHKKKTSIGSWVLGIGLLSGLIIVLAFSFAIYKNKTKRAEKNKKTMSSWFLNDRVMSGREEMDFEFQNRQRLTSSEKKHSLESDFQTRQVVLVSKNESIRSVDPVMQKAFNDIVAEILSKIPTQVEIQKLTDQEVHLTPEGIRLAGRELGRLAQIMDENPLLVTQGVEVFKSCALNETYPDVVRAICLADVVSYFTRLGKDWSEFEDAHLIPAGVQRLAGII